MLLRNCDSWQGNIGVFFPSTEVFSKNTGIQLDKGHFIWIDKSLRFTTVRGTIARLGRACGYSRIRCILEITVFCQPSKSHILL